MFKILVGLIVIVLALVGIRIFVIVFTSILEMRLVLPYEVIYTPRVLTAIALAFSLSILVQIIRNRTG